MTTHSNFFHLIFNTKKENHTSKTNHVRNRSLRLESLEERRLLSVTPYEAGTEGEFAPQYVLSNSQDAALIPDLGSNTTGTFKNNPGTMAGTTTAADDSFYTVSEQPLSATNASGTKTIVDVNAPVVNYAETDYNCLQAFLEQVDSSGVKNGTKLNPAYSPTDPTTWTGVTWETIDGVKRATSISWYNKKLSGSLDVSGCTALTTLYCSSNQLTSLDVSKNTALTNLWCSSNQLTLLDVSKNTALTDLWCSSNQLTLLDVSMNTALERLYCSSNQLTLLDVSKNTALADLWCDSNQLTLLDVSKNTALTDLWCYSNQLMLLDVSKNTALTDLWCSSNQLTLLDVSMNTALTDLWCDSNQLTSLDVSKNTALTDLRCDSNQLTSLDVSKNTALEELYCWNSGLQTVEMSSSAIGTTKIYPYSGTYTSWTFKNSAGTAVGTTMFSYYTVSELPLSATNAAGTQTITFVDVNALSAPALNQPTASETTVSVSWSSVANASSYALEYKLSTASTWTTQTVSETSATFTGTVGSTYDVRVKAIGTGNYTDSAYSSEGQFVIPEFTVANNDFTQTKRDTAVSIDALANDRIFSLADTVITLGAPSFGSVALNEDGTFLYTPNEKFFGTDVFAYSITGSSGTSSMAAVSVMVQAPLKPVVLAAPSTNRAAGALPKPVAALSDWDSCCVELWLPDDDQLGTGTTSSTFVYNPAVYKDPVLSSDSDDVALVCSAPILRADGMAEIEISITVTAPQSSSGDSLYLGVISLDPNADGVGLTNTAPAERLGSLDGQAVETTVEPFAFDLQRNRQVDMQDFIEFAKMFNQKVEGNENPLVAVADFDGSGTVDMQDFIQFAMNFNKKKSDTANEPLPVSSSSQSPNVVAAAESEAPVPAAECADVSASCPAASSELCSKPVEALSIPVSTAELQPLLPRHITSNAAGLDLAESQNQEAPVTASSVNESTVRDQVICDWDEFDAIASGPKASDSEQSGSPLNIDWFDELELSLQ